ncbi:hypothetical protein ACLKA6_007732 [Drosophila palustris]
MNKSTNSKSKNRARRVTIQWSPQAILQLIEAVEDAECLWNVADADYKNRNAKEVSWNIISEELGVSNKDVLDKWNSLRNTYRSAFKTSLQAKIDQNGYARKPSFPYYEAMSFLEPILTMEGRGQIIPQFQCVSTDSDSMDLMKEESIFETSSFSSSRVAEEPVDSLRTTNDTRATTRKGKHKFQPDVEQIEDHKRRREEALFETSSFSSSRLDEESDEILKKRKHKFSADVEAFGELVKAEMEQIEDPKKRRAMRLKILQIIAEADI